MPLGPQPITATVGGSFCEHMVVVGCCRLLCIDL
jgi:hypothetical protein